MNAEGVFAVFGPYLAAFGLVLARFSGLVLTAPFFSSMTIPTPIKMGLVGTLTLVVMIQTGPMPPVGNLDAVRLIGMVLGELAVGGLMGMAATMLFGAVSMAGQLIGTQMGLSMASLMDPVNFQQVGMLSQVLNVVAMLLFLVFDGHLMMLRALFDSFQQVPIGTAWPDSARILTDLTYVGSMNFELGLRLAFPVIVTVLFVNLGLGIIARTVPQVNVFQLGFLVTISLGLLMLALSLPGFSQVFRNIVGECVTMSVRMAKAM